MPPLSKSNIATLAFDFVGGASLPQEGIIVIYFLLLFFIFSGHNANQRSVCGVESGGTEDFNDSTAVSLRLRLPIARVPARHKGAIGGEGPFAGCKHLLGDSEQAEY